MGGVRKKDAHRKALKEKARLEWLEIPARDKELRYAQVEMAKREAKNKLSDPIWLAEKEAHYYTLDGGRKKR